jgi:hypothetical protein
MATGDEQFETPSGNIDGANVDYTTSLSYQAGTLRVWLNGILVRAGDDDGWVEDDPGAGTFHMNDAPRMYDQLVVRYIEA